MKDIRKIGKLLMVLCLSSFVTVATGAGGGEKGKTRQERRQVTGPVVAVDTNAGTLTIGGRKGDTTFKITKKTVCVRELEASLSDLQSGQRVSIRGNVSEDQSNIAASVITIVITKGAKRTGVAKMGAAGVIQKEGDKLSLQVGPAKRLAVITSEKTKVLKQSEAKLEDVKVGAQVQAVGYAEGDELVAAYVLLRAPLAQREKPKKPRAKG
jgi:hypothetical protein